MLEIAHTAMHIGANEEMAQEWLSHADSTRASPWTVKKSIRGVAAEMNIEDPTSTEYDVIYRDANMAKHGNPMALGALQIVVEGDSTFILAGPNPSPAARRAAHVALLNAIRYTKLAAVKFGRDHMRTSPRATRAFEESGRMSGRLRTLPTREISEFGAIEEDPREVNNG
jgi:hypothetical protein